jgi:hypothetical protein
MDNPEPRAQYLNAVLRQIERTALRIPRFQRGFVWGAADVLDLLESIEKGYPIGSILTWRVAESDDYFAGFREGAFPPADKSLSSFEVVLDGAQRLSSLYGCLRNPSADPAYEVLFDLRSERFVQAGDLSAEEGVFGVPMDALFDSRKFLGVQSRLSELPDGDDLLRGALDLYATFQEYQIPIVAIAHAELEEVVEVFRRVNSTGTRLSAVDFVRALTWRSSFDLEETFDEFAERYEGTPVEGLTEDYLIRCLAVVSDLSLEARDVVQLKDLAARQEALTDEVQQMRDALDRMAVFLARFEVRGISEVPYEVQRLLLFALMLSTDPPATDQDIENWFWQSTFAEEYQGKPDSFITRSVREIRHGDVRDGLAVRKTIDLDLFAERVRRGGAAVATGFDLLLRRLGARSLLSGEPLGPQNVLHASLFSRRQLEADALGLPKGQLLANVVYLTPDDAAVWKRLSSEGLAPEALREVCQAGTGQSEEIWASQGLSLSLDESPREVLRERSRALLSQVVPQP